MIEEIRVVLIFSIFACARGRCGGAGRKRYRAEEAPYPEDKGSASSAAAQRLVDSI